MSKIDRITYKFDDKAQALSGDARRAILQYTVYFFEGYGGGVDKKKAVEYYRVFDRAWYEAYGDHNFHVQETARGVNFAKVHIGKGQRA